MTSLAGAEVPAPVSAQAVTTRVDDLHRRYRRDVLEYCVRHLRSREEGEDAAQTVFLNAYRSLAKGTEPQYERAWLFAIAEHVVSHRHRTNSRRLRFEVPVDVDDLAYLAVAPSLDDAPDLTGLVDALSEMPALERRALVLRELRGFTYKEVASELGVSGTVVETLLTRGRRRLADRMHDLHRTGKRALGLCLPWPSLQSLLGSGAAVKGIVGLAASVAIFSAAIPLHQAGTKPPARAKISSRPAAGTQPTRVLRPSSTRFAPVLAVVRQKHARASSAGAPAASATSPTIAVETPAAAEPAATSSAPVADLAPATDTTAPAGDVSGQAPGAAGPPGQSQRSLESDPKGPPSTTSGDGSKGSSADGAGQPPHGEPR